MSRCIVFALAACFLFAGQGRSDILFSSNSSWKYFKGTEEASSPANAWRQLSFDDAAWPVGAAAFFYGESLSGTTLGDMSGQYSCVFIRKTFTVADPSSIGQLKLDVLIDDGFVAWINGVEVFRFNMPAGEPLYTTVASTAIEPETRTLLITDTSMLVPGQNVIAIQGFNSSVSGSSDFALDAALTAYLNESVRPTIATITPPPSVVAALSEVTVSFSEPVMGIEAGDLLINGSGAAAVSGGGATYTFSFLQPAYGTVQIGWASGHGIVDFAATPNSFDETASGASWQYNLVDSIAPTISEIFPPAGATIRNLAQIEVTFSEEVTGVDATDLRLNGQPATNVVRLGRPFIFQFPAAAAGTAQISWAAGHGITDLATPANAFVGANWSYQVNPSAAPADLLITEILAANVSGLQDEDADQQEWIEIYNRGSGAVNLAGWSLSDDPDAPGQWSFPSGSIGAGEYLIVFASGKDRRNPAPTNRFHTNFRLAVGGEFLGLYAPDSPRSFVSGFTPDYPEQRNDHSYGLDPNGAARYFATPTPGAPNGASTILALTEPVHFSVARGFYSNAFDLHLSTPTFGAGIRYTTDGSEPTAALGAQYAGPLRITNWSMIRAVAFRQNFLPSRVNTHTYIFTNNAAIRSLPVVSIVTARSNLYGATGIMGVSNVVLTTGANPYYVPATNNGVWVGYHNPSEHGIAWERPTSAELISPLDNSGFQIDCGIRIQGSDWQRPRIPDENWKFSYRFYFRGDYGEGRLEHAWFPTTHVENHDQVVVRAGYNDPSNPFVRDEMARRVSGAMGQVASHGSFVNVYVNGRYKGYYNPCQRVHEEMLQQYHGGSGNWDVVGPSFATGAEELGVIDGDRTDFVGLINYVWGQTDANMRAPGVYNEVARRLDLVNFVDYLLLNAYTYMGDWPANNWRAGKDRGPGGIWRFYVWDGEWSWGFNGRSINGNTFTDSGSGANDSGLGYTAGSEIARLFQKLRQNPEYRLLWADRIHKHMFNGGAITDSNLLRQFNILREEMRGVLPNMDLQIQNTWIPQRRPIFLNQCQAQGFLASSNAPAFSQHGGPAPIGYLLTMTNLSGTMYYTVNGVDPRVPFTAAVSGSAQQYTGAVQLTQTVVVKARTLEGTNWSALTEATFQVDALGVPLRITEIMYNPAGGNSAHEYLELQNIGPVPLDLSGMTFDGISFTFPTPFVVAAGARVVLASNADTNAFAARYPGVAANGYFGGQLANGGERITLEDRFGNTVLSVDFNDEGLWPTQPDGSGYSLELLNVHDDPDDPLSWSASTATGGSPGAPGPQPPSESGVRINEVLANGATQWVEVYNPGPAAVDLGGYSLTDDSNARKYVFPSTILNAGAYLVFDCTANAITLNTRGDEVLLYDAQSRRISSVSFGTQIPNYSLARRSDGALDPWTLGAPTPGEANALAALGASSSVVINEWLANPFAGGEDDWIELYNPSAQPVALKGAYLGTSNVVFRITSRSFIAPSGFVQLLADENPGPDHLDFRLPAAGGQIVYYDNSGIEADRVQYEAEIEGVSQGRLPDGASTIRSFAGTASPGASNYVIQFSGPYINEVMARNVSANTNGLGRAADWIEIYNPSAQPVDLGGMSLSVDVPENRQWVVPANTIVPAGGYLVLWCDGELPATTTATAVPNVGRSLNGEDGGVYLFDNAGQLLLFVEYGFQLENQSIGRVGGNWRLLSAPTLGEPNAPTASLGAVANLSINEWMANPIRGDDWFEIYNAATQPIDLGGMTLTDDPSIGEQDMFQVPPLSFVPAGGWVRYRADGNSANGFHHVNFSLAAEGESIRLYDTVGANYTLIDGVYFGAQAQGVSEGRFPDGDANIVSFQGSASPGDSNYLLAENVVINEIAPSVNNDIELFNPGSASANLGGWFLSDSRTDLKNYQIAPGTVLAPGAYLLIVNPFALNDTTGGEIILSAADSSGNLTGVRVQQSFRPVPGGGSAGRFSTSQGEQFDTMAQVTLRAANGPPRVGPVVISEVMYNPLPWPDSIPDADGEYIELRNITSNTINLNNGTSAWRLTGGTEFEFPAGTTIPANGYILVVNFDPFTNGVALAEFRARYSLHFSTPIYGPYRSKLDNAGDEIELLMPGGIRVDYLEYGDSTPWPSGPVDGGGLSLQRRNHLEYGNEPLNWVASDATPAGPNGSGAVALPTISTQPQNQSVLPDEIVQLAVEASGSGTLTYQWRFNGVEIPDANAPTLRLDYVQIEHDGVYDVLVANEAGAVLSAPANLRVNTPPQIMFGVQNFQVLPGANVVFSVGVRGSKPLSYQWSYNGSMIPGATNATYAVNDCQLEQAGEYSVLLNNAVGSAISVGSLIVRVVPTWIQHPQHTTVVVGDDATFRAFAIGTLPMGYIWRTNSRPMPMVLEPVLTLPSVPLIYSNMSIAVVATNLVSPVGRISSTVRLFVLPDSDSDRLPDIWEDQNGFDKDVAGEAGLDTDGDDMTNREEYLAGTNPRDPLSYLRVDIGMTGALATYRLNFLAVSNKTYTLQYRTELSTDGWSKLMDVESRATNRIVEVIDYTPTTTRRFYQVVTPQQ